MRLLTGIATVVIVHLSFGAGPEEAKRHKPSVESLTAEEFEAEKKPEPNKPKSKIPSQQRKALPSSAKSSPSKQARTWREPVTGMEFVYVPGGCFQMGCGPWTSDCDGDESPVHEVCVDGFWMGKFEVTQGEWEKAMGNNPSEFKKGNMYPVETASWNDAHDFVTKLNSRARGGFRLGLPSEAQWEYACRSGGKSENYPGGNNAESFAWYQRTGARSTQRSTQLAGTKAPNGLGLYDLSGNVHEWCEDKYDSSAYSKHEKKNPVYGSSGSLRVIRGGSWYDWESQLRCASRNFSDPSNRSHGLGFRLVRTH